MPAYLLGPTSLFPGLTTPAHKLETILVYGDGFGLPTSSLVEGSSSLFLANCYLRPTSSVLSVLIASGDARCGHSFPAFDRRLGPTGKTGRLPFRGCRVSAGAALTTNPQSWPQACAQPTRRGSYHRCVVYPFHAYTTRSAFCCRSEAFHSAASPQLAPQTKISPAVFAQARASTWPEGT